MKTVLRCNQKCFSFQRIPQGVTKLDCSKIDDEIVSRRPHVPLRQDGVEDDDVADDAEEDDDAVDADEGVVDLLARAVVLAELVLKVFEDLLDALVRVIRVKERAEVEVGEVAGELEEVEGIIRIDAAVLVVLAEARMKVTQKGSQIAEMKK